MTASGEDREVDITVRMKVSKTAMFLANAGATVDAGEFEGSSYVTDASGGSPVVYVRHNKQSIATAWIPVRDLIEAMLLATVKAVEE